MTGPTGAELDRLREKAQADYRELRKRKPVLDEDSIDLIIRGARSHTAAGATSMNTCPARFIFVTSDEGKERLSKALKDKNVDKMKSAPVTAILAYDLNFWEDLPFLFPHEDRRGFFKGKDDYIEDTALSRIFYATLVMPMNRRCFKSYRGFRSMKRAHTCKEIPWR